MHKVDREVLKVVHRNNTASRNSRNSLSLHPQVHLRPERDPASRDNTLPPLVHPQVSNSNTANSQVNNNTANHHSSNTASKASSSTGNRVSNSMASKDSNTGNNNTGNRANKVVSPPNSTVNNHLNTNPRLERTPLLRAAELCPRNPYYKDSSLVSRTKTSKASTRQALST